MKASCSMFSQVLKLIPRIEFERLVSETGAEYRAKGLSSWSQFVGMLFCQLGRAHTLREIEGGLMSCEGKMTHLGIEAPKRSSLSYANGHRPWELFEKVFYGLYEKVAAKVTGKRKFRFKNKPVSLDSTTIDLCLSMYDWAKYMRTKGAVKLHLMLDHDGYLPQFAVITDGKVSDVEIARQIDFAPGTNMKPTAGSRAADGLAAHSRKTSTHAVHRVQSQSPNAPYARETKMFSGDRTASRSASGAIRRVNRSTPSASAARAALKAARASSKRLEHARARPRRTSAVPSSRSAWSSAAMAPS